MKRFFLPLLAIACLSLPVYALAGHHGDAKVCSKDNPQGKYEAHGGHHKCGKHRDLTRFDSNKDKKVSFKEFSAGYSEGLKDRFKRYDTDGDGFLTDADKELAKSKHVDHFFKEADANHDGALSKDEFTAAKHSHHSRKECSSSK